MRFWVKYYAPIYHTDTPDYNTRVYSYGIFLLSDSRNLRLSNYKKKLGGPDLIGF